MDRHGADEADQQRAKQRADDATHTANHNDSKSKNYHFHTHAGNH
jgi:hypothetical protein